jgi:hypothetical protein
MATYTCVILVGVFIFTSIRGSVYGPVDWGDIGQALLFQRVRQYLLSLQMQKNVPKFWRPSLLLLAEDFSPTLLGFCDDLKKGGILVWTPATSWCSTPHLRALVCSPGGVRAIPTIQVLGKATLVTDAADPSNVDVAQRARETLLTQIKTAGLKAFPHVLRWVTAAPPRPALER